MEDKQSAVTEYGHCVEEVGYPDGGRVCFYSDSLPSGTEETENRNQAVALAARAGETV